MSQIGYCLREAEIRGRTGECWIETHHDANVSYVDTVGPRNIKYDLRCSIDVRLDIIGVQEVKGLQSMDQEGLEEFSGTFRPKLSCLSVSMLRLRGS